MKRFRCVQSYLNENSRNGLVSAVKLMLILVDCAYYCSSGSKANRRGTEEAIMAQQHKCSLTDFAGQNDFSVSAKNG